MRDANDLRTPDMAVRAQIEAAKAYFRAEGFTDVDDPPEIQTVVFERNQHTIHMNLPEGSRRIFRADYGWLSEHTPAQIREWLVEKEIGRSLKEIECSISQSGLITWKE